MKKIIAVKYYIYSKSDLVNLKKSIKILGIIDKKEKFEFNEVKIKTIKDYTISHKINKNIDNINRNFSLNSILKSFSTKNLTLENLKIKIRNNIIKNHYNFADEGEVQEFRTF